MGMLNMSARIGGILSPFLLELVIIIWILFRLLFANINLQTKLIISGKGMGSQLSYADIWRSESQWGTLESVFTRNKPETASRNHSGFVDDSQEEEYPSNSRQ